MSVGELGKFEAEETATDRGQSTTDENLVFDLLKNDRRRQLIELFERDRDALAISDVAEFIAEREAEDTSPDNLYKSVYVSLQQTHLPKLAEHDVVRYDRDEGLIRPGENLDEVLAYTRLGGSTADGPPIELFVSLLGLCVTLGVFFGVPPLTFLPVEIWATLLFGSIIALNLARLIE
jgi:hypothetical protein